MSSSARTQAHDLVDLLAGDLDLDAFFETDLSPEDTDVPPERLRALHDWTPPADISARH